MNGKWEGGKGSRYRRVDLKKWERGWELAFGKNKTKQKENNDEFAEKRPGEKEVSDSSGGA